MSEQNMGKKTSSKSTIIATAIVALAAVAAIIVLLVMSNNGNGGAQEQQNGSAVESAVDQAFIDECGENAQRLVQGNYRVVRLFISEGLPHRDEPYGNSPEDGYFTVVSDEFKTLEDVENLVKSTFVAEEADRIMQRMPTDPAVALCGEAADPSDFLERPTSVSIFGSRVDYVDNSTGSSSGSSYEKKNVLGINELFKPYTDYKKPWGSTSIRIVPVSEEECDITIYLGADKDVELASVNDSDILTTKMIKTDGEWRLTELVY